MHFNSKLIGWVVVLIIVLGTIYSLATKTGTTEITAAEASQTQTVGADLLTLLAKLKNVNFSTDLFSETSFTSLIDFAIPLPVPNLGRPNPFEKIGIDIGPVSSKQTNTQITPAR